MKKKIIEQLKEMPFFTLKNIRGQCLKDPLPKIKYDLKTKKLIGLKRGVYVYRDFVDKIKYKGQMEDYLEFLGTRLILPSYVSLEYMLSKYSILSESPFVLTLITPKTTRTIKNALGTFSYFNIKDELFCGFNFVRKGKFEIRYASKAKSLFDFIYFKKQTLKTVNKEIIEELRLNLDEMQKYDWEEFEEYVSVSKSKKMKNIFKILKKCSRKN